MKPHPKIKLTYWDGRYCVIRHTRPLLHIRITIYFDHGIKSETFDDILNAISIYFTENSTCQNLYTHWQKVLDNYGEYIVNEPFQMTSRTQGVKICEFSLLTNITQTMLRDVF